MPAHGEPSARKERGGGVFGGLIGDDAAALRHGSGGGAQRSGRVAVRRRALVLALAVGQLASWQPARAQAGLETAVKAAYLYKFAAFVEWPASAFDSATSPAQICIAGPDPFGGVLDQAIRGQKIGDHPITVVRLDRVDRGAPCHILFVSHSLRQSAADALSRVRGSPILTVTDANADPADRGVIDFVLKDGHVRFRIDARAASQNGLAISSKLLNLALKPGATP